MKPSARRASPEAAAREAARQAAAAAAAQAAADAAAAAAAAAAGGGGGGGSSSGGTGGQSGGSGWARPASGWISSWFGGRGTICGNGYCVTDHRGIDFATNCGNSIYAAASGRVIFAAYSGSWGNYIKIDHGGGIVTGYAHIRAGGYAVGVGQSVSAGQVIAYVGSTGASSGCHLHFEVYSGASGSTPRRSCATAASRSDSCPKTKKSGCHGIRSSSFTAQRLLGASPSPWVLV